MLKRVRNRHDDALSRLSWDRFEHLLADHYRQQGYEVEHCGTAAQASRYDGGIDLKLRRGSEYTLVQCKHWNARQVPHNEVHQLLGLLLNEQATGAILVTSGEFTAAARTAADKLGRVRLVDGVDLRRMIGPLPDPEPAPERGAPPYELSAPVSAATRESRAAAFASVAAERLLSAAEDRIRGGNRRARANLDRMLLRLIVGLVFAGLVLVTFQTFVSSVVQGMAHSRRAPAVQPTVPAPVVATGPVLVSPPGPPAAPVGASAATTRSATIESGMTGEELREWKKRNEEAMKILEATTPEL